MSSAKASGASTGSDGTARNRDHNQGNQERKYTAEQKAAVIRIRKCNATAFYDILGLEAVRSTCSESDIKKAYRKQSLLTHPDKNGHEHADDAFKMVSRAFGVLGDKEKREKYDRSGTDPDSRWESARAQNPFNGFGGRAGGGGAGPGFGGFGEEISPEEMFARFFGAGFGGQFPGGFGGGPQFVFNLGGDRGFRVHNMGGPRVRPRPREAGPNEQRQEATAWDTLISLVPILFLFVFPLLTSIFSGGSSQPSMPGMAFDKPEPPYTIHRTTKNFGVNYYVDPREIAGFSDHKLSTLDKYAETNFINVFQSRCEKEVRMRQHLHEQAQGWFYQDPEKMRIAREFKTPSCERLESLKSR